MIMHRRFFTAAALVLALGLSGATAHAADEVDGTFKFEAQNVGIGVKIQWGEGTLTLKDGSVHNFAVEGLQLVGVGYSKISAKGEVMKMKSLEDFNGTYTVAGAGGAVIKGKAAAIMANSAGVELRFEAEQDGVELSAGGGGLTFKLK